MKKFKLPKNELDFYCLCISEDETIIRLVRCTNDIGRNFSVDFTDESISIPGHVPIIIPEHNMWRSEVFKREQKIYVDPKNGFKIPENKTHYDKIRVDGKIIEVFHTGNFLCRIEGLQNKIAIVASELGLGLIYGNILWIDK